MAKPPWSIYTNDPVKLAGYLIGMAGGVKEARKALREAIEERKRGKAGRPAEVNDWLWLGEAAKIKQEKNCSDTAALRTLADRLFRDVPAKNAFVRRLLRKLSRLRQNPPNFDNFGF